MLGNFLLDNMKEWYQQESFYLFLSLSCLELYSFLGTFREILLPSSGKVNGFVCGIYVMEKKSNRPITNGLETFRSFSHHIYTTHIPIHLA